MWWLWHCSIFVLPRHWNRYSCFCSSRTLHLAWGEPEDTQAIVFSLGLPLGQEAGPYLYIMFQCKHLLFPLFSHTWRDWKVLHGCWWRNAINFFHPSPAHRALQTAAAFLAFLSTSQDAFSSTNNGRSIVSEFLLPITKWNRTALCLGFSPTWSDWNAFSQMTTGVQTLEFFAPAPLTFCIETLTSMLIWLGPAQQARYWKLLRYSGLEDDLRVLL